MERNQTERQEIVTLLQNGEKTAIELSKAVRIMEREVYAHLSHIKKSMHGRFFVSEVRCLKCGYTFRERTKSKPPSKCPQCKESRIDRPRFAIR